MYKNNYNCFCLKPTPIIDEVVVGPNDNPPSKEVAQPSQQTTPAPATGGNGIGTGKSVIKKFCSGTTIGTIDENNKRVQCDECKHEEYFEWCWDKSRSLPSTSIFDESDRNILFNPGFSVGTGAVRGTTPLEPGKHHFFEILMNTEVYGTDMMIGVGTEKVDLHKFSHSFVHFLGYDNESWGLSYSGDIHHGGNVRSYTKPFSQGTYVGVHVDLWTGTLEFYINRKPIGKAFSGLQNKVLYPMISSTAARSGMGLSYCRSFNSTLQLQALLALGRYSYCPESISVFNCPGLDLPPGLKHQIKKTYWWISSNRRDNSNKYFNDNEENKENKYNAKQTISKPSTSASSSSNTSSSSRERERIFRRKFFFSTLGYSSSSTSTTTGSTSRSSTAPTSSSNTTTTVSSYSVGATHTSAITYTESHSTSNPIPISSSSNIGNNHDEDSSSSSTSSSPPLTPDNKRIRLRTLSLSTDNE